MNWKEIVHNCNLDNTQLGYHLGWYQLLLNRFCNRELYLLESAKNGLSLFFFPFFFTFFLQTFHHIFTSKKSILDCIFFYTWNFDKTVIFTFLNLNKTIISTRQRNPIHNWSTFVGLRNLHDRIQRIYVGWNQTENRPRIVSINQRIFRDRTMRFECQNQRRIRKSCRARW